MKKINMLKKWIKIVIMDIVHLVLNHMLKKKSYEQSSKVTRNVAEKYETFEEKDIINRNIYIISELNRYTNYKNK